MHFQCQSQQNKLINGTAAARISNWDNKKFRVKIIYLLSVVKKVFISSIT